MENIYLMWWMDGWTQVCTYETRQVKICLVSYVHMTKHHIYNKTANARFLLLCRYKLISSSSNSFDKIHKPPTLLLATGLSIVCWLCVAQHHADENISSWRSLFPFVELFSSYVIVTGKVGSECDWPKEKLLGVTPNDLYSNPSSTFARTGHDPKYLEMPARAMHLRPAALCPSLQLFGF